MSLFYSSLILRPELSDLVYSRQTQINDAIKKTQEKLPFSNICTRYGCNSIRAIWNVEGGLFNVNARWEFILGSLFEDERGCSREVPKKFDISNSFQRKPTILVIRGVADFERFFRICNSP